MKMILEFDGYEDREEFEDAWNGGKYKSRLEDIWNEVFRPCIKHGSHPRDNRELTGEELKLIECLADKYHRIMNDE